MPKRKPQRKRSDLPTGLDAYRDAATLGDPIAQWEALWSCWELDSNADDVRTPRWLAAALLSQMKIVAARPMPGATGRHSVPATRAADDAADMRRYARVQRHRFRGESLPRSLALALVELQTGTNAEPGLTADALRKAYRRTEKRLAIDPSRYLSG
jgi:hypothetical protein